MHRFSFPGSGCHALLARELTEEVCKYRNQAFADSTKRTYRTHRDAYLRFCAIMKLPSVPASSHTICQYAAFLARSLSYSSVKQYLNVIALLHKEFGLPNPLAGNWHVSSVLTGIKRVLGDSPQQKLPITVSLLLQLHSKIQLSCSVDASFWAICLVSFFGMFRKSHMVVTTASAFNAKQQFTKSDFRFFPWGVEIIVRWSKTIQFRERQISIPLPRVSGSPLCPVSAILHAFSFTASAPWNPKPLCGFILHLCACSPLRIVCFCLNSGTSSVNVVYMGPNIAPIPSDEGVHPLPFKLVFPLSLLRSWVIGNLMQFSSILQFHLILGRPQF